MTFFFFSDLFHNFRFAFFLFSSFFSSPTASSNFSRAAGICVNITSSATLGCNFLVFVVKMTSLCPGPTSADGGPSSHQRLTGCFGHYIHHKEMTPCILEKRLRRSAI